MLNRHDDLKLDRKYLALRERFVAGRLSLDESLDFYNKLTKFLDFFPYDWEEKIMTDNLLINGINASNLGRLDHLHFYSFRPD